MYSLYIISVKGFFPSHTCRVILVLELHRIVVLETFGMHECQNYDESVVVLTICTVYVTKHMRISCLSTYLGGGGKENWPTCKKTTDCSAPLKATWCIIAV